METRRRLREPAGLAHPVRRHEVPGRLVARQRHARRVRRGKRERTADVGTFRKRSGRRPLAEGRRIWGASKRQGPSGHVQSPSCHSKWNGRRGRRSSHPSAGPNQIRFAGSSQLPRFRDRAPSDPRVVGQKAPDRQSPLRRPDPAPKSAAKRRTRPTRCAPALGRAVRRRSTLWASREPCCAAGCPSMLNGHFGRGVHMSRFIALAAAAAFSLSLVGANGCGGNNRPGQLPPGVNPGLSTEVISTYAEPLIVDWDSGHRTDLEVLTRDRIAVVRYQKNAIKMLKDCSLEGEYGYVGVNKKEDIIRMDSLDEVAANLPGIFATAGAKLGAEMQKGSTIDLGLVTVGKRTAVRTSAERAGSRVSATARPTSSVGPPSAPSRCRPGRSRSWPPWRGCSERGWRPDRPTAARCPTRTARFRSATARPRTRRTRPRVAARSCVSSSDPSTHRRNRRRRTTKAAWSRPTKSRSAARAWSGTAANAPPRTQPSPSLALARTRHSAGASARRTTPRAARSWPASSATRARIRSKRWSSSRKRVAWATRPPARSTAGTCSTASTSSRTSSRPSRRSKSPARQVTASAVHSWPACTAPASLPRPHQRRPSAYSSAPATAACPRAASSSAPCTKRGSGRREMPRRR